MHPVLPHDYCRHAFTPDETYDIMITDLQGRDVVNDGRGIDSRK